jgi:hypothetical protein
MSHAFLVKKSDFDNYVMTSIPAREDRSEVHAARGMPDPRTDAVVTTESGKSDLQGDCLLLKAARHTCS